MLPSQSQLVLSLLVPPVRWIHRKFLYQPERKFIILLTKPVSQKLKAALENQIRHKIPFSMTEQIFHRVFH